eukprot:2527579-Heterocapsa_arctica.AAC.1
MTLYGDAAAARGISHRFGVGRIKHLEVKTLWLQQFTGGRRGDESVMDLPVSTKKNIADVGTKPHGAERLEELKKLLGLVEVQSSEERKQVEEELLVKDFIGVKRAT